MPYVALFFSEATVEAAVDVKSDIQTNKIPNTEDGIDVLVDWLRQTLPEGSELMWFATIPQGDGGPVYAWLTEAVPEVFLQNPAPLRAFAEKASASWQSARTLLELQRSKKW
jgi:hypothetical protein